MGNVCACSITLLLCSPTLWSKTQRLVEDSGACLTINGAIRHLSNVLGQDQSIVQDMPPALLGVQSWGFIHCRCVAGRLQDSCLHGLVGVCGGVLDGVSDDLWLFIVGDYVQDRRGLLCVSIFPPEMQACHAAVAAIEQRTCCPLAQSLSLIGALCFVFHLA